MLRLLCVHSMLDNVVLAGLLFIFPRPETQNDVGVENCPENAHHDDLPKVRGSFLSFLIRLDSLYYSHDIVIDRKTSRNRIDEKQNRPRSYVDLLAHILKIGDP